MPARLFSKTGETRGLELILEAEREAFVGRDPTGDLVIEHPLMSGRHARIFYDSDAGRFMLEDLDSLNGTELDGDRVTGSEHLGHLNVITFAGSYDFFFFDSERCERRHPNPPTDAARQVPTEDKAAREPPVSTPPVSARPASGTEEVTSVESEPIAMPGFLARRADAISASTAPDSGRPGNPADITLIEDKPVALPNDLVQRADKAQTSEKPADEEPAGEKSHREKTPDDIGSSVLDHIGSGNTLIEKLPVGLPGILARRSEEAAGDQHRPDVQKHETVDLAQIESLIAAEEVTELGTREALEADGPQLIVTESGGQVRQFPLTEGENLVGRGASADVVLKYPDLSRRHAMITVADEKITLRDFGSRNRTFINDRPADAEVDIAIEIGDRLRFGSVEARLTKVGG